MQPHKTQRETEDEVQTFGLPPKTHWKLFEHQGYQVLAYLDPGDEDEYPDEPHWMLVMEGYIEPLGATSAIKLGTGKLETAQQMFDMLSDPEKVVTTWLSQVGPAVQAMSGEFPDLEVQG